jgi:hypothetical protein
MKHHGSIGLPLILAGLLLVSAVGVASAANLEPIVKMITDMGALEASQKLIATLGKAAPEMAVEGAETLRALSEPDPYRGAPIVRETEVLPSFDTSTDLSDPQPFLSASTRRGAILTGSGIGAGVACAFLCDGTPPSALLQNSHLLQDDDGLDLARTALAPFPARRVVGRVN